jgi:hypothetical protein
LFVLRGGVIFGWEFLVEAFVEVFSCGESGLGHDKNVGEGAVLCDLRIIPILKGQIRFY